MITSINPYNQEVISEVKELTKAELVEHIEIAHERFLSWRKTTFEERATLMQAAAADLKEHKEGFILN